MYVAPGAAVEAVRVVANHSPHGFHCVVIVHRKSIGAALRYYLAYLCYCHQMLHVFARYIIYFIQKGVSANFQFLLL